MNVLLLGAPGSGKGTQAQFIMDKYQLQAIATGNLLRSEVKEKSEIGNKAHAYMEKGDLVPDNLIIQIISNKITGDQKTKGAEKNEPNKGYLFDGFPRNVAQASALNAHEIKIDVVVYLSIPDALLEERIVGRRVHVNSGRVYHIKHAPPKTEGLDDVTREALTHRADDQKETVKKRLSVYNASTKPLIEYYKNLSGDRKTILLETNGNQSIEMVSRDIFSALDTILG